jgi:DNA-binding CsgD family transcriptional regulator
MKLLELESALMMAKSILELNKAIVQYLRGFGITTFSFTYYYHHPSSHNKLKYDFATPNFEPWHKHYLNEGYEDIDSTLDFAHKTTLPTFWNLEQQLKEAKTPREKQMRLDSIAFGVTQGLSISIHGPQEDFATLTLVQMKNQKCLDKWRELQYEMFAVGHYYYFYLQQHLLQTQGPNKKYQLNRREIQCLTLVAKQYTMESIAKALQITERTVNYHIQRFNKKLGTQNKYQSVIKALQNGVIKL